MLESRYVLITFEEMTLYVLKMDAIQIQELESEIKQLELKIGNRI